MPEVRLIDANALIDELDIMISKAILADTEVHYALIRELVAEQRTFEAEPVRHGRWIEVKKHRDENGTILTDYECSECFAMVKDLEAEEIESERFCYNCGADMREEEQEWTPDETS